MRNGIDLALTLCFVSCSLVSCNRAGNPLSPIGTASSIILFTSDNQLCMINPDGTNLTVLASAPMGGIREAHLSRDGSKVVYASVDTTYQQVFLLDINTLRTTNLTHDNVFHESPIFSPDSKSVLFLSANGWLEAIYSEDIETGQLIQLTSGLNCRTPAFSSDGSRVVFWLNNGLDSVGVAVMDRNGNDVTLIGSGSDPQFFPDGRKILFNDFIPPDSEGLYIMNADGTNRLFLSGMPFQTRASISPNGTKIVFSNFVNDNFDIFIMTSDGSQIINLTNSADAEFDPSFSPDGKAIVYLLSDTSKSNKLCTMNIDGTNKRVLVENRGWLGSPSYWHY